MTASNEAAIQRWCAMPRADIEAYDEEGDFAKRHLLNAALLRMLGGVAGRRILDAGCGQGYFSRMLASHGARVVGVEPARTLIEYAREVERERRDGISYVEADLCRLPDLGRPFEAVVASMVFSVIPDWQPALKTCAKWLEPGGVLVFSINHPCFEELWPTWRQHGDYRTTRYLQEYEIQGRHASDFHRTLTTYVNAVTHAGLRVREVAEPGLDPAVASDSGVNGIDAYVHLPNFLVIAAERRVGPARGVEGTPPLSVPGADPAEVAHWQ